MTVPITGIRVISPGCTNFSLNINSDERIRISPKVEIKSLSFEEMSIFLFLK